MSERYTAWLGELAARDATLEGLAMLVVGLFAAIVIGDSHVPVSFRAWWRSGWVAAWLGALVGAVALAAG